MLIEPTVDILEEKIGNRHALAVLAAKRARDLGDGMKAITAEDEAPDYKNVSQAAKEIAKGYVTFKEPKLSEEE